MSAIPATAMATLERLTDPVEQARETALDAMARLNTQIGDLRSAADDDGDCLTFLEYLAFEASDALDELTKLIEEKRG